MPDPGADRFFVVGGQRCGTTSLYHLLDAHPQIRMVRPVRPEPKLFVGDDLERRLAEAGGPARGGWWGEKSVIYFDDPGVPARIAARFPAARILVVLREPIARALSNYRFSRQHQTEVLPVDEALDPAAEERPYDHGAIATSPFHYLRRGHYLDHLRRFEAAFPPSAVHVALFEELRADPQAIVALFAFLGLPPPAGAAFGHHGSSTAVSAEEPSPARRAALEAHFAPRNAALAAHLGRDLDRWWGTGG